MRDQTNQTSAPREIPVRWIERSWEPEVGVAEAVSGAGAGSRGRRLGGGRAGSRPSERRIAVTSRERFSQPSRAQRHRR